MANSAQTILMEEGVFIACTSRHSIYHYSCCKFKEDDWIMLLPGEFEAAEQQGLKREHLKLINKGHAIYAECSSPCQPGDFKPVDCSWYPLFPANPSATLFLATDNVRCPIPHHDLIDKMFEVQASALLYEQHFPGTLERLPELIQDFIGYVPLAYKIENGSAVALTLQEIADSPYFAPFTKAMSRSAIESV